MTNAPQDSLEISRLTIEEMMPLETRNSWYEKVFTDRNELSKEHVIETLLNQGLPFAEYANKFQTFFFIALHKVLPETPSTWTITPAFSDRALATQASPRFERLLHESWGHVIIGPSGDAFSDSEQIGVKDRYLADGTFAFDVTAADGIAVDEITVRRNTVRSDPSTWVDWSGGIALGCGYYEDPGTAGPQIRRSGSFKF